LTVSEAIARSAAEEAAMSVSETFQLTAPTATPSRSGIVPLVVVLAIGVAVLVLMLATGTGGGGSAAHHVAGAHVIPHLGR
jgi:hypothetical protein